MKILKLSAYYEPEQIASSHLTRDLEEAYINKGFTIRVITPTPSRTVSNQIIKKYKSIKYETKFDGKIEIIRFRLFKEGNNVILRALRYFISMLKQYKIGKKQKDVDIIISGSTPPIQGLLVSKLKKKLKVPMIYVLQDIFPDSLLNTGIIKRKGIIWKIGRKIEDYTYKNADKIIVISEDFKKNIIDKGVNESKIEIVNNWININSINYVDIENNYLFDKYKINRNKFIVTYCGNLGLTQNLEMVLSVAKEVEIYPDILFVIIGEGKNKENLIKLSTELKTNNVMFLPFQPSLNISEVYSIGNIGLIVSKENIGNNSVPSKLFTMMATNQPILASFDCDSDLCKIIKVENVGVCVAPENKTQFAKELLRLYRERELIQNIYNNGRTVLTKYYSKDNSTDKYVKIAKQVIFDSRANSN